MKNLVLAASLLSVAGLSVAGPASAEGWHKDRHPYARHHHEMCQDKAHRLHTFEMRARADGHLSHRERDIMRALANDLDASCGRFRWHR